MKTVCAKHQQAYEIGKGCLYCPADEYREFDRGRTGMYASERHTLELGRTKEPFVDANGISHDIFYVITRQPKRLIGYLVPKELREDKMLYILSEEDEEWLFPNGWINLQCIAF